MLKANISRRSWYLMMVAPSRISEVLALPVGCIGWEEGLQGREANVSALACGQGWRSDEKVGARLRCRLWHEEADGAPDRRSVPAARDGSKVRP